MLSGRCDCSCCCCCCSCSCRIRWAASVGRSSGNAINLVAVGSDDVAIAIVDVVGAVAVAVVAVVGAVGAVVAVVVVVVVVVDVVGAGVADYRSTAKQNRNRRPSVHGRSGFQVTIIRHYLLSDETVLLGWAFTQLSDTTGTDVTPTPAAGTFLLVAAEVEVAL